VSHDSIYDFIGERLPIIAFFMAFAILSGGGAWSIARSVCKKSSRAKNTNNSPILFLGIFVPSFFGVALAIIASISIFVLVMMVIAEFFNDFLD